MRQEANPNNQMKREKNIDERRQSGPSDNILKAPEMAEEIMPKIDSILSKLRALESKIRRIENCVGSVDDVLSQLREKV